MKNRREELINFIKKNGGIARFSSIKSSGFHPDILKKLEKSGAVDKIGRGFYRIAGRETGSYPDFVDASIQCPKGVFCLITALSYYEITDEIPRYIDMAIPAGGRARKIEYPPVKFYRFARAAWETGIEEPEIDGYKIRIYSIAKTIADCVKFRSRIGMDVIRNAIRTAINEKKVKPDEIMKYAKICRVDKIIKPVLEAML